MNKDNKGLVLSLSVGLIIGLFSFSRFLHGVELKLGYDFTLSLKKKSYVSTDKIKIIGIDSKSIEKIGVFPWRRDFYSKLIKKLGNDPKIISFDILLSEQSPHPEDDDELAEAIKTNKNVILPVSLEADPDDKRKLSFFYPIEDFTKGSKALGLINFLPDDDGILRKTKTSYNINSKEKINVMPYEIAKAYLDTDIKIPETIYCNFEGTPDTFEIYSFYDVLTNRVPKDTFKDSIVLIGATAEGLQDRIPSPIGPMYGVIYHAQLVSNILKNNYIKPLPTYINMFLIFLTSLLSYFIWKYFETSKQVVFIILSSSIIYAIHLLLFTQSIWFNVVSLILTNISVFISLVLLEQLRIASVLKLELDKLIANYYKKNLKYRVFQTNANIVSPIFEKYNLSNTERIFEISKIGRNLTLERSFLETLLNNIKIPIIVTNYNGTIILGNPVAEDFFLKISEDKENAHQPWLPVIEVEDEIQDVEDLELYEQIRLSTTQQKSEELYSKEHVIGRSIFKFFELLPSFNDHLTRYYNSSEREPLEFEDQRGNSIYKMRLFSIMGSNNESNTICLIEDVTSWHQMANKDGLTGIWNQRYFKDQLQKEIDKSKRYKTKLSLIMMDVDHFKKFNDTYGHQTGDIVLKNVAKAINESVRTTDIAARYGGEEFTIILTMTDEVGAILFAERLRKKIEALQMKDINNNPVSVVTTSVGVCFYEDGDMKDFIERADTALYACKDNGRNCVTSYSQLQLKEAS